MTAFKAILIEHGYATTDYERDIISAAGGEFLDADHLPLEEALHLCEEAEAIMCRRLEVTPELIRRFRRCKIILRYGVGTDNVHVQAATEAGIIVGHVPAYCVDEVSSHAIALLLACTRRLLLTHKKMERGGWEVHRDHPLWRMAGRTLGLVGLGNIGSAVARKMQGWNLRLLASDPFVEPDHARSLGVELVGFETLCRQSDYLSLHCPLLPETRHLISERTLSLLKPGAILVNTARGPLVDNRALLTALESGRPAQAGLDVFEEEPLPLDSPFPHHPNVIVSDHTAWYSEESQIELQKQAAREVVRVCTGGLPESLANPEVLKRLGRFSEWVVPQNVRWQLNRMKV
jgi:D-3-phosphoglycerate dehydrogenase / 2-oxoglutarate reductase